ncbi:hypothetical protein V8J38_16750 (plasmid) [Brevundimonas olei]|uniref:Uncharacterized protein n=1 Tax=Brevundimonas olei TaxID=657642 RepID=A0ABZ2ILI7_9CAUL
MTERNGRSVSVRLPRELRRAAETLAFKNGGSVSLNVSPIIQDQLSVLSSATVRRASRFGTDHSRINLCLGLDLHEALRNQAEERCVTISDLVFTLLDAGLRPIYGKAQRATTEFAPTAVAA